MIENIDNIDVKIMYKDQQRAYSMIPQTTATELRKAISNIFGIPNDQLALHTINENLERVNIKDEQITMKQLGVAGESLIVVKNLGKQIGWSTVFYIEYLGPIIIIPLFYFFGKRDKYELTHHLAAFMGVAHFVKRQLQTKYIHVFSRKTMPFKRVFINSAHYWIIFGLLNSIQLFLFPKAMKWSKKDTIVLFFVWLFMEFSNLKCHIQLASFRKQNKKGRGIPKHWGFKFVSCANYLWQSLGWLTFSILTRCYSAFLFTVVSTAQMASWAKKKHREYKQQFGQDYPKNRKAMFPFLL